MVKQRLNKLLNSKHMLSSVGVVSFMEATVVPIPLETVLIPLMQAKRERLWLLALFATLGCLLGSLVFYFVGLTLFEQLQPLIFEHLTTPAQFQTFTQQMQSNGFVFIFSTGVTPIPLQLATLAAGVTAYPLILFIIATTLSRITRYFGLAIIVYYYGDKTEKIVRKYGWKGGIVVLFLLILGWLIVG